MAAALDFWGGGIFTSMAATPLSEQQDAAFAQHGDNAAERLARGREVLAHRLLLPLKEGGQGAGAEVRFERAHSDLVDAFLRERLQEIAHDSPDIFSLERDAAFALVAVGGYGRRELCLHSDVDLLLVCEKSIPPQALDIAQPLFLTLWDQGYDLGHGFRTVRDCQDLAVSDFQVFASLLDLRFIAGDLRPWKALTDKLQTKIIPKKCKQFLRWLEQQHVERRKRFGQADAALEPQLKDGLGGLRDRHRLLWLARCLEPEAECTAGSSDCLRKFFPAPELLAAFDQDAAFLLAVRNQLHRVSGRKNEKLHLDLQPPIAAALGFDTEPAAEGVEAFLARLHRAMANVRAAERGVWKGYGLPVVRKGPEPEPQGVAPGVTCSEQGVGLTAEATASLKQGREPALLLRLFAQCAAQDEDLSWQARQQVQLAMPLAGALAEDAAAWQAFLDILESGNASQALGQMAETGFLDSFLPPFGAVRDLVQFDAFHTYPVGWHTIVTVDCLEHLPEHAAARKEQGGARLGRLAELWERVRDKRSLLLAALFHDLGKGGPEHEEKGAAIARKILTQRGMPADVVETVAFLVQNHLLLLLTATRKDLGDESVVLECANATGSVERLRMLYLLSCADARATGPKAWNDWTARLLAELFDKTANMLQEGRLVGPHAAHAILKTRDDVRTLLARHPELHFSTEEVELRLEHMPPHYLLRVSARDIVGHLELVRQLEREVADEARRVGEARAGKGLAVLEARKTQDKGIRELAVAARNQPGLFASIAGVLSLHDLNIFAANAFVWSDGNVLAVFQVSAPADPLYEEDFWARIRGALKFAMTGKLSLDYRLDRKRHSMLTSGSVTQGQAQVNVDNESTDFYTVVEVLAWDRLGLLYEIAHTLQDLQVEVHLARVATHEDQVADYFHVRDAGGQKIDDQAQLQELRQALLHRLSRPAA